ncbi:GNAT family N-acetyltransferase [Pseudoflavonifractor sp. 60]|mgnify:FL=1|uniref:GNAT family N-acetyltransferase n=1 Tax=Pseudoflavonifractor sp. 60 TaxID=2304576 RepID=UPI001367F3DF|nr:GNAT family N-acetyltransferase [Pseudoflavonifractor sp. 60]
MNRIYTIIQKEKMKRVSDEILASLSKLEKREALAGETSTYSKQEIIDIISAFLDPSKPSTVEKCWDFSQERTKPVFIADGTVLLRPLSARDAEFYAAIREQYSIFHKDLTMAQLIEYWSPEIRKTSAFYCVIEVEDGSHEIGYIAVKDTSKELWEIAIELDKTHCGQGCGSKAITLFLKRLNEITTKNQFQFLVEVDNIPCQSCMKKAGAELTGLHNFAFDSEEAAEQFEETHLALITEHMRTLAAKLGVEPRKLLSHVLDYRINI